MNKAEKFIEDYTKDGTNQIINGTYGTVIPHFYPWITHDSALKAVEIAREEIYEWLSNHYRDYMHNPTGKKLEVFFGMDMITDLKHAMKDG